MTLPPNCSFLTVRTGYNTSLHFNNNNHRQGRNEVTELGCVRYEVENFVPNLLTIFPKYCKIRKSSFDELGSELKQKKYPFKTPKYIYNIITLLGGLIWVLFKNAERGTFMSKYKVNKSELWVGREFKNYKEICAVMGWEAYRVTSNSGQAQLKELEQHCKWTRAGHKYIITEVTGEVTPVVRTRRSELQELSEEVMVNLLANAEQVNGNSRVLRITKLNLFQALGYVNQNFNVCYKHQDITQQLLGTSSVATRYFFERTYDKADDRIQTMFKRMESQGRLIKRDIIVYCDLQGEFHEAVGDDLANIINVRHKAMKKMGYDLRSGESAIIADGRWGEYVRNVNEGLKGIGIRFYYKCYEIAISDGYEDMVKERYHQQQEAGITIESLTARINAISQTSNTQTFARKQSKVEKEKPLLGYKDRASRSIMSKKWKEDGKVLFKACGDVNQKNHLEPKIKEKLKERKKSLTGSDK